MSTDDRERDLDRADYIYAHGGDAPAGDRVAVEQDEARALLGLHLDTEWSVVAEMILDLREMARRQADHNRAMGQELASANARMEKLESLLRSWMTTSDLARDITFVPIYKRTEHALSPESRETEPKR